MFYLNGYGSQKNIVKVKTLRQLGPIPVSRTASHSYMGRQLPCGIT